MPTDPGGTRFATHGRWKQANPAPSTPRSAPPVTLRAAPEGRLAALRYTLRGQGLLWWELRRLARLPPDLSPTRRFTVQRAFSARILRHLRVRAEVRGPVPAGGPFLIVALHESVIDPLCLVQALPLPLRFVARDEIFGWPGVGPAVTRLGHVAIHPEAQLGGYRTLLRAARDILAGGESLVVFAQGTVAGIESDFQRGAFELARRLAVPVLPVALSGTHRIWEHPFTPALRYGQRVTVQLLPVVGVPEILATDPDVLRVRVRRALKTAATRPDAAPPRHYRPQRDGYWDGYRLDIDPDYPELARHMADHRAARAAQPPSSSPLPE